MGADIEGLAPLRINPNLPPHIRWLRFLPPSPNSSFHFLRSASDPVESDNEGTTSLSALSK